MSTALRLALAAVLLSLLATLASIAAGDLAEVWATGTHLTGPNRHDEDVASSSLGRVVPATAPWSSQLRQTQLRQPTDHTAFASEGQQPAPIEGPPGPLEIPSPAPGNSPSAGEGPYQDKVTINLKNEDIAQVLDLLGERTHRNILTSENVKGPITVTLYDTEPEEALKMILKMKGCVARTEGNYTFIYTREEAEQLEKYGTESDLRIYRPVHISAQDLQVLLSPYLSPNGIMSTTRPNEIGIAANSDSAGGDSLAINDVVVVEDYEAVLRKLDRIVREVDVPPAQVLIEAVLLSVDLDDDHRMGVNFALLADAESNLFVSGIGKALNNSAGFPPATLVDAAGKFRGGFADDTHGLKYGVIRGDLTAFVDLLETVGHTTIVANPKVLALNKQRAEILVGRRLGFKTRTITETAAVEEVQFLDTGTQLRIRPFIQADGRIRMELHPELSSAKINPQTLAPDEETTSVTTNLVVASGTTIVIGGLIEERQERTILQVPLLGSLPVIGRAFRDETTIFKREELIVLITPRVINEAESIQEAQEELGQFRQRRDSLERLSPHYSRVALARHYYEKASQCRAQGDWESALELVEQALEFEPTDPSANRLREELLAERTAQGWESSQPDP